MSVFLDGVAAQFYRGIGAETQYIAPFGRLNFFIGRNNAGKSVVLELISRRLPRLTDQRTLGELPSIEQHVGEESGKFRIALGKSLNSALDTAHQDYEFFRASFRAEASYLDQVADQVSQSGTIFTCYSRSSSFEPFPDLNNNSMRTWKILGLNHGAGLEDRCLSEREIYRFKEMVSRLASYVPLDVLPLPPIHLIPAKRVLGEKGEAFNDLSGKGLIDHLAALQNPALDRIKDKQIFHKINAFLQSVTGKPDAEIEVPHTRDHLLVHMDNKVLPLSSLGTGIHEVVLIAAFCTIHDQCIMCIEEPEIHLHPVLQRKLIRYLLKNTENQYFIATHSAAFLDTEDAHVFHVSNDGIQTRVRAALTKPEQRAILDDLGAQASDILQANAVIWVEGPSDRIYLSHWIAQADPELIEGTHYTIMFYGGALIRHLSASDDAVEAFIRLRDLNRHMVVVIDSDRDAEDAPLKPHASRLLEEFDGGDGMLWITKGREVENYVDPELLHAALKEIHPQRYLAPAASGPFDHAFYFMRPDPKRPDRRVTEKAADKVAVARWITQQDAPPDRLDLAERLATLTTLIRRANGMPDRGTIEDIERGIEED